ncbi:MAG: 30S ribosomal protein S11 [Candidatus Doudnabacteria bacterium CG10_big_fil_rev_8_21_14_0_10_41_10]|uniref:Small ribosomal subunit protein uS11 n=1 Tax=Candidatus Doudnabacteria bacterium CG10_big_fil_rev_8_21_14_0_10_41_10 TaxID=1974551 RepID=A0A2H0VD34_9BACT|nr:MAG: 30S ribosomal protein S11 [Candidatus Doudnabacteria bacterium CG10_big_fil_rev_8_21_14_0_10_41_10]
MGEQKVKTLAGDELKAIKEAGSGKKKSRKTTSGQIYISSSYNNTIITITDDKGNVLTWGSSGMVGFRGSKKSTPFAAQRTMEEMLKAMKGIGITEVDIFIKGIGTGRESAVRALNGSGIKVRMIQDRTPIPHGGVRKKKPRRV